LSERRTVFSHGGDKIEIGFASLLFLNQLRRGPQSPSPLSQRTEFAFWHLISETSSNRLPLVDLFARAKISVKIAWFTSPHKMEGIQTHPSNAAQAKAFTAPGSLSFPGGANELATPAVQSNGAATNGVQQQGVQAANGTGVTPATPAATPGAGPAGPSGITPTLQ
jgi:hypothetical protein